MVLLSFVLILPFCVSDTPNKIRSAFPLNDFPQEKAQCVSQFAETKYAAQTQRNIVQSIENQQHYHISLVASDI